MCFSVRLGRAFAWSVCRDHFRNFWFMQTQSFGRLLSRIMIILVDCYCCSPSPGPNASILELADSMHAAEVAKTFECDPGEPSRVDDEVTRIIHIREVYWTSLMQIWHSLIHHFIWQPESHQHSRSRGKKRKYAEIRSKKRRSLTGDQSSSISTSTQMVGFGLPNEATTATCRRLLPEAAAGPPYFYYANDASTPKEVWATISHLLYDVEPEFVDSKHFCAASRKRAYVHNLPIQNRFPVMPMAPKTIQEALPATTKWWPSWDTRTHLNCFLTNTASARLTDKIRIELQKFGDPPPLRTQRYVLDECRRWNLIWVGPHKVAPLEPDEIEMLLGFPKDHTRGGGITRTERYRSLGNSFQVDTVAYHLSVLKDMFPNGMTVLSLFSGIGGAEVALHRLGIHLKTVVSLENSQQNRNILKSWWDETNQTGTLIELPDVRQLDRERLELLIARFGGFDLVIGGSPCRNLAGSDRHRRDGLQGDHSSSLFYEYFRILELVRCIMGKKVWFHWHKTTLLTPPPSEIGGNCWRSVSLIFLYSRKEGVLVAVYMFVVAKTNWEVLHSVNYDQIGLAFVAVMKDYCTTRNGLKRVRRTCPLVDLYVSQPVSGGTQWTDQASIDTVMYRSIRSKLMLCQSIHFDIHQNLIDTFWLVKIQLGVVRYNSGPISHY